MTHVEELEVLGPAVADDLAAREAANGNDPEARRKVSAFSAGAGAEESRRGGVHPVRLGKERREGREEGDERERCGGRQEAIGSALEGLLLTLTMSLLRRAARSFKLGKEKFYIGSDLEGHSPPPILTSPDCELTRHSAPGNAFYERPSLEHGKHPISCPAPSCLLIPAPAPKIPTTGAMPSAQSSTASRGRSPSTASTPSQVRPPPLSHPITQADPPTPPAVQWNSWMRRTRREPPTLAELEADYLRQQHLQTNVARLAEEYREEKLRKVEPSLESRGRVLEALAEERRRRGDEEVLDEIVLEEVGATEVEVEVDVEVRGETEGEREKALLRRQFGESPLSLRGRRGSSPLMARTEDAEGLGRR